MLASVTSTVTSHVASQGVYAVFILMAIDAVFPAASELVMLYAGAVAAGVFASAHHVSFFGAHIGFGAGAFVVLGLAGTLGYLVGAIVGWAIGLYGWRQIHITPERFARAERWFARWGNVGVLVGRLTPVVRSFVSIPAGALGMPLGPYTLLTLIGSAIWAFSIAGIGYGLGSSYKSFDHGFKYVEYAVVAGVVLLAAYLVSRWLNAAKVSRRRADDPAR
ncbi:MAG TPA: DedA family protein [Gaiellaceae bacterium]|nr:DedA family protein [Gaiellaceae bacterium]